jgi:hypothetical protein
MTLLYCEPSNGTPREVTERRPYKFHWWHGVIALQIPTVIGWSE